MNGIYFISIKVLARARNRTTSENVHASDDEMIEDVPQKSSGRGSRGGRTSKVEGRGSRGRGRGRGRAAKLQSTKKECKEFAF